MVQQLVIADHSRGSSGRIVVVIGVIFACMGAVGAMCGVGWVFMVVLDPDAPNYAAVPAAGCGVCLLPGLALLAFGLHRVRVSRLLGVPTLTLPSTEPLCLGETVAAWFCRNGGTAPVTGTPALSAMLVCQERITYRSGTDDHTRSQDVYRMSLPVTVDQVAGQVSGHLSIQVPVDQPPSMNLRHNEIIWTVRVKVRVPGVPDDEGTFKVIVRPAVAAWLLGDAAGNGPVAGEAP